MAGAPGAAGEASPEQLAPEQPQQGFLARFLADDQKCQLMLLKTLQTNPYVKLLLDAMKRSGCAVNRERHFSCEDCNGNVSGGFDASVSQGPAQCAMGFLHFFQKVFLSIFSGNSSRVGQWWSFIVDSLLIQNLNQKHFTYILIEFSQFYEIVLCQNNIRNQAHMNRVVTHELIHTFDHCRAHVDWFTNVRHLACSEIRAANLSGDCSLVNEIFRLRFGLKQHHQTCVRDRAILSILAVRNVSKEVAEKAVDEVFESCFNDHEPFGRIPHNKTYAKYAHRDFQNRHRYYSNI